MCPVGFLAEVFHNLPDIELGHKVPLIVVTPALRGFFRPGNLQLGVRLYQIVRRTPLHNGHFRVVVLGDVLVLNKGLKSFLEKSQFAETRAHSLALSDGSRLVHSWIELPGFVISEQSAQLIFDLRPAVFRS